MLKCLRKTPQLPTSEFFQELCHRLQEYFGPGGEGLEFFGGSSGHCLNHNDGVPGAAEGEERNEAMNQGGGHDI